MPASLRRHLLVVQEHEAALCLVWDGLTSIPIRYEEGREVEVEDDIWYISSSRHSVGPKVEQA